MEVMAFFGFMHVLVYIVVLGFGIYFLLTVLKLMKEKNNYLKEISEDIKEYTNK